tara:strand:- start:402 stop:572 length:171 start_codon:yes stop_codon:yes gene_type:complete
MKKTNKMMMTTKKTDKGQKCILLEKLFSQREREREKRNEKTAQHKNKHLSSGINLR